MVQVIAKLENHKGKLAETLGMSLGQGIGNGLNTFFANRSLDSVLHDKALKDAPQSQKLEAMRSALSPYGEKGQEIFNQRMQIEQQEMQENQERKNQAQQKIKGKAIGKLSRGEQLSDEEWERASFTPQEVAALHKAYNPKPAGGATNQPVPPEQINAIERVINENPGASPNELGLLMGKAGVNPIYSNPYIENQRRGEERDIERFSDERDYHSKISRPIIEKARENLKSSAIEKGLEEQLRRDIDSGNASGLIPFMVDKMGLESFRNPESARFTNAVKNLFVSSLNEIPGARPNQFIERFLSTAQPLIGRDPESNLSVLDVNAFVRDIRDEHDRLTLEVAKEDRNKLGFEKDDISERAWDKMGDFANRRQEKMATDIRERHEKDRTTADLLSEVIKGEVPKNTPLTPKMMQIFYIKNDKDVNKALEEAKKAGFVLPEYLE